MSTEDNYKKRELDYYFAELNKRLDCQDKILDKMSIWDERVIKLEWWQKAVQWALGALWALIIIAVPIGYMILRYIVLNEIRINSASSAKTAVEEVLKNYKGIVQINEN